jgi:hypothetical protein
MELMGGMKEATADFAFRNCMDVSHVKLSKNAALDSQAAAVPFSAPQMPKGAQRGSFL